MTKILPLMVLTLFVFSLNSCGLRDSEKDKDEKISVKEKTAEKEKDEENTIPKQIIEKFGNNLPDNENIFTKDQWNKINKVCENIIQYKKEIDGVPDKKKVEEIMQNEGFDSFKQCKREIEKIARLNDFLMTAAVNFQSIKMKKMTGTEEEVQKQEENFLGKLKAKQYTLADYRLMDKKKEVIPNAFSTLIVLSMISE